MMHAGKTKNKRRRCKTAPNQFTITSSMNFTVTNRNSMFENGKYENSMGTSHLVVDLREYQKTKNNEPSVNE